MKNLRLEQRNSEESEESAKIKKIHDVLANEIFYPLYQNMISIDTSDNNLSTIIFTASQIRNSLHYNDGLEHLEQSIPKFLTRFDKLEMSINKYNENLTNFRNDLIERCIYNHILSEGFLITYNANSDTPPNTINLTILLPELKSYWFGERADIPVTRNKNSITIPTGMGSGEIATVNNKMNEEEKDGEKIRVETLVNDLKDLYEIKNNFIKFHQSVKDIRHKAEELKKDVGENIIKFYELDQYDETCKICNK